MKSKLGLTGAAIVTIACVACTNSTWPDSSQPTVPLTGQVTSTCTVSGTANAYELTLTNPTAQAEEVTGFVVTFNDSSGTELGSDTEPGNGAINGAPNTIQLQDWIETGQSWNFSVTGTTPTGAVSCSLASWNTN